MNNINNLYKMYTDKCQPWKNEDIQLEFEDITVLDDEVGSLVYLQSQNLPTPALDHVIESIKKELYASKRIENQAIMINTVKNLSLLLFICEQIQINKTD